jgi:hypothetical protein
MTVGFVSLSSNSATTELFSFECLPPEWFHLLDFKSLTSALNEVLTEIQISVTSPQNQMLGDGAWESIFSTRFP